MRLIENCTPEQMKSFYQLVQNEWNEDFIEITREYAPRIILGIDGAFVVAGMAVFREKIPESKAAQSIAQKYIHEGADYLGYFVVDDKFRGQGMGSKFMQMFLLLQPNQKFWFVVEDPRLQRFYEKNSFRMIGEVGGEKIFVRDGCGNKNSYAGSCKILKS